MLHPKEWAEREDRPETMWIHGLDAVEHCLKGDVTQTAYKNTEPALDAFERFTRAMQDNSYDYDSYNQALENQDIHDDVWKDIPSDMGDLDVDSYIEREEYIFEEAYKKRELKPAINIIFEFGINAGETSGTEIERRHEKIYPMVLEAQAQGVPTRVIAAAAIQFGEWGRKTMRVYMVIKDWEDPIFPGIWGALRNNNTANAFCNVLMDYIVGTHDYGNGRSIGYDITDDLPEDDEIILVECDKLRYRR